MKRIGIVGCLVVTLSSLVYAAESKFFANQSIEAQAPAAFALQPESAEFLQRFESESEVERTALVAALQADPELVVAIVNWATLSIEEQIPFLHKVFAMEVKILGIAAPELVIENDVIPGVSFFEFDPDHPTPGRVLLNPKLMAQESNKYASLALLVHETRHSAQFQLAFMSGSNAAAASAYRAAFLAQKKMAGALSFCDFLTLNNEFDAFHFGNYVIGELTHYAVDDIGMGTYASQFDAQGALKIDLAKLARSTPAADLINVFNQLENAQYEALRKR